MNRNRSIYLSAAAAATILFVSAQPAPAATRESETLEAACEVLDAFVSIPLKGIPPALLRDAQGVAIIPNVIKAGLVLGGRHGHGVVLARDPAGIWSRPAFVTITGGGIGWQVGVQSTDLVLVFKTKTSVEKMLQGKGRITLGADVAVAAGPLGRQAEAGTDAALNAEIFSYSRSRGLFVGLSLEGAALAADAAATEFYYRTPPPPTPVPVPPPDERLRMKLTTISAPPPPIMVPPPGLVPR